MSALVKKQALFAYNVALLIEHIYKCNHKVTFAEAYRTPEQAKIYAEQKKGIKNSLHCKRLAIDLNLFDSNNHYLQDKVDYEPFGRYWKNLHPKNRWGGDFSKLVDCVHFEMVE